MGNITDSIQCYSCGASNPSDAQFCQKCGAAVPIKVNKCKRCGTSNDLSATFCKKCGAKLSEARLGVTVERAEEWWDFLNTFDFFREIWSDKGLGWQIHNQCKIFQDTKYPDVQWECSAFAIPIASSDWCIKLLEWRQCRITYGEILGTTTDLIIFDLPRKMGWKIPYEEIESTDFDGWTMLIALADSSMIKLHIKETGAGFAKLMIAFGFLSVFSNQSAADREAYDQSTSRVIDDVSEKRRVGARFWESIDNFFGEVFSHA